MSTSYVFVYGSLRKSFGHPQHHLLEKNTDYIGKAHFQGKLYNVDWYPGVVDSSNKNDRVTGELYKITQNRDTLLNRLDRYEGCLPDIPEPHEFIRRQRPVELLNDGSLLRAWIYLYNRQPDEKDRILSGDYVNRK